MVRIQNADLILTKKGKDGKTRVQYDALANNLKRHYANGMILAERIQVIGIGTPGAI